jgi:hypothetical protein
MSRTIREREDLMRDATALIERVELRVAGQGSAVVAGFRRDGRLSIYFGDDPAFHFDEGGRLRRAFVDGDLYRSQGMTLARLRRRRDQTTTELQRHDLDPAESQRFAMNMTGCLRELLDALVSSRYEIIRQVPPDAEIVPRLCDALERAGGGELSPALKR